MQTYTTAELEDDDGELTDTYHYVLDTRQSARPAGYCAGTPALTRTEYEHRMGANAPSEMYPDGWDSPRADGAKRSLRVNQELVDEFGEKFHTCGHESEAEAIECYTQYCLDTTFVTWRDEYTDRHRQYGVDPGQCDLPVTGDDIPPDVSGTMCEDPDCSTYLAYPTAMLTACGTTHWFFLCERHAYRNLVEDWWTAPSTTYKS